MMGARYSPASFNLISRFHAELDRIFREALELGDPPRGAGEWQPSLDIVETPEAVIILVELPGVSPAEVQVEVRGTQVIVSGTKSTPPPAAERVRFQCMERGHGRFRREVQLFWPVNSHQGTARLADGLLAIEFPKIHEKRQAARVLHIEDAQGDAGE